MRTRIEDLLRIRDGEPVDANLRVQVAADPESQAGLERLEGVQNALKALPELQPPPGTWKKIRTDVQQSDGAGTTSLWRWPLRSAIAAGIAVLALMLVARPPEAPTQPELGPATTVAEGATGSGLDPRLATPSYASLVAESARLERALNGIGYRPRVTSASTASTIAVLEDRIGYIDTQLTYATARRLNARQTEALWRERVDLMNALVSVRYAQAQRVGF